MPATTSRSPARGLLLAILALTFALYAPSLRNTFALDDRLIAKAVRDSGAPNVMVGELQPLGRYFTTNYWQGVHDQDVLYRPVTILSYAVLHAAVGRHARSEAGEALPQHAANVSLHVLATWLVYLLVRRLRLPRGAGLVAALVFGVHAIHSEVVAGVVGRAELLAFVFGALASLAFVHACDSRKHRVPWLAASAVALFLAMGSKESGVAWAPWLLVAAFVRRMVRDPGQGLGATFRPIVLPWALAALPPLACFLALRAGMLARIGADSAAWTAALEASTSGSRLGNALVQWAYGLASSVVPLHLAADHGPSVFTPMPSPFALPVLACALVLAAVLAGGLLAWRRQPVVFLATATFFGHSFLTSNVPFRIGTEYAERLYYTPSLGLSFVAAWLAMRVMRGGTPVERPAALRRAAVAMLALWTVWNGWLVLQRNRVWRDDATLYTAEVVTQPRSARMQLQYAELRRLAGDVDGMARHLHEVVELFPEHAQAWNMLGAWHFNAGRKEDAVACLRRSLTAGYFDPGQRVEAAFNLALALATTGRAQEAIAPLEQALATAPRALAQRTPELRRHFTAPLPWEWFDAFLSRLAQAAPGAQPWAYHRAWLANDARRLDAAAAHARQALGEVRTQPFLAEMQMILAAALANTGKPDEARRLAQEVLDDVTAPDAMRSSARELIGRLR